MKHSPVERPILFMLALLSWLTLALQFYLIIENRATTAFEAVIRFFSYFTILSNNIVAICYTALLAQPPSKVKSYFEQAGVQTAVLLYIVIVGLVYNLVLRSLWNPTGLQKLVDESLHSIIPAGFLIYWFLFGSRQKTFQWHQVLRWLIFPFFYCIYILIRGAISGFYPYPFMDADALGIGRVLLNSLLMLFAFLAISILLIWIAKLDRKSHDTTEPILHQR